MRRSKARRRKQLKKLILKLFLGFFLCFVMGFLVYGFFIQPTWLATLVSPRKTDTQNPVSKKVDLKEEADSFPTVSSSDWNLLLVNRGHLTEMTPDSLVQIEDIQVDSRIAEMTNQFLRAVREIEPAQMLISGYRSQDEQTELYDEAVLSYEVTGYSHDEAENLVQKQIQIPGASEHQTGLAIDISTPAGQTEELAARIAELAPQYGFILRYPEGKSDVTGVDFENWHYRYVGVENAQYMQKHNLVLEEYLDCLKEAGR